MLRDLNQNHFKYRQYRNTISAVQNSARERDWDRCISDLEWYIASARGEQHDSIVYAAGCEFDSRNEVAVKFVSELLLRSIDIREIKYQFDPNTPVTGVVFAITPEEYARYRYAGGTQNSFVEDCIRKRAMRVKAARIRFGTTYTPYPMPLAGLLDKLYVLQQYYDIDIYTLPADTRFYFTRWWQIPLLAAILFAGSFLVFCLSMLLQGEALIFELPW